MQQNLRFLLHAVSAAAPDSAISWWTTGTSNRSIAYRFLIDAIQKDLTPLYGVRYLAGSTDRNVTARSILIGLEADWTEDGFKVNAVALKATGLA